MEVTELLEKVKNQEMTVEEAREQLRELPYEDMGFAKLDHHRRLRSGFGEVIYCAGKTVEQTAKIFQAMARRETDVLGTRASREQYEAVKALLPDAQYHEIGRVLRVRRKKLEPEGLVAVCTGGTSDMPVAEEAALTAEFFGARVERIYDVGVAGIHRLLDQTEKLRKANCILAIAGMDRGIRSQLRGAFRPADYAEFLRGGPGGGEHRQWLRRRISGGSDQPAGAAGKHRGERRVNIWIWSHIWHF